ncbi:MAG: TrkH family potassium uptake protein [Clostridiales bacterium]|nr:TrkH family potassium uptake protein [Clostridiales bacterium]MCF8021868.1 TrkH family potassium uptake protein [Clostridiales bacterium]
MKNKQLTPNQLLAASFISLILLGTILLHTSWAVSNENADWLTSLFTATSAVCVTGLVVVDTGTYWSSAGQFIILMLIQIGGLGVMAFATFFALLLGRKIQLRQRLIMQEALNKPSIEGIVKIFRYLLVFSFIAELAGTILLTLHWMSDYVFTKALWYGVFHSVSAFNNAGFALFGNFNSLTTQQDTATYLIISTLFVISGLGFVVINEIFNLKNNQKISLHSKIVLISTLFLIISGTLIIYVTESNHALQEFTAGKKLLAAYFHAVTPRTAGFNTLDISSFLVSTQILIMSFMLIGGSPGSTAGGTKTTTNAVIWIAVYSVLRGKKEPEILNRRIASQEILRALSIMSLALLLIFIVTFLLSITQQADFIKVLFEAVSAMGTVGLSLGLTRETNEIGRIILIITMFLGRLGPLTIGSALALKKKQPELRHPEGKIMLG